MTNGKASKNLPAFHFTSPAFASMQLDERKDIGYVAYQAWEATEHKRTAAVLIPGHDRRVELNVSPFPCCKLCSAGSISVPWNMYMFTYTRVVNHYYYYHRQRRRFGVGVYI